MQCFINTQRVHIKTSKLRTPAHKTSLKKCDATCPYKGKTKVEDSPALIGPKKHHKTNLINYKCVMCSKNNQQQICHGLCAHGLFLQSTVYLGSTNNIFTSYFFRCEYIQLYDWYQYYFKLPSFSSLHWGLGQYSH